MSALRQTLRSALALSLPRRWLLVNGPSSSDSVCLTFDDGPHPEHTPRLLDVLREQRVTATFFVIGEQAEKYPALVRRMVAEGHAVAQHSYFHREPSQTSARELMDEVRLTMRLLAGIGGGGSPGTKWFRPPKGQLTAGKMMALRRAGLSVILWNVDPRDYKIASAAALEKWFAENPLKAGDIVLLHDVKPYAAEVITQLAADVRRRGLEFTHPLESRRRAATATVAAF